MSSVDEDLSWVVAAVIASVFTGAFVIVGSSAVGIGVIVGAVVNDGVADGFADGSSLKVTFLIGLIANVGVAVGKIFKSGFIFTGTRASTLRVKNKLIKTNPKANLVSFIT